MYSKIVDFFSNKLKLNGFVLVTVAFIVWMTFFDKGRWPVQFKLSTVASDLQQECEDYKVKIEKAKSDKN